MSIGLTRLFYQLQELGLIEDKKKSRAEVLVLPMEESFNFYAIDVLNTLKEEGVQADIYLEKGKFKKKINYADKVDAKYVAIIGEEEVSKNEVSIRNMKTGEQFNKSKDKIDFCN